jgi:hypothetical protein
VPSATDDMVRATLSLLAAKTALIRGQRSRSPSDHAGDDNMEVHGEDGKSANFFSADRSGF